MSDAALKLAIFDCDGTLFAAGTRLPLPGVAEMLAGLEGQGWLLAIATSAPRRELDQLLKALNAPVTWVSRQCGDRVPAKPAPDMVFRALDDGGVVAARAVLVGDSVADMQMAANAGVAGLGVSWGAERPAALTAAGALFVAGAVGQLPNMLERMIEICAPKD